jgi:enediyne biosynthesis protein E4
MNQPQGEEERDDAIVGQAFVWSGSLLLVLVAAGVGIAVWARSQKPIAVEQKTVFERPQVRERPVAEVPAMPFTDITEASGIRFVHESGATGEKLLPETMGGGCAFLDYDGDGDQDIFLVNSCRWVWDTRNQEAPPTMALYRNDGDGKFADVTKAAGLDVTFYGQGVAVGDYDGDGDVDLFISAVGPNTTEGAKLRTEQGSGPNRLFRNEGGKFVDATAEAGVAGCEDDWGTSCGFLDYDNDGDLDLFVANYVKWTRAFDKAQPFTLTGGERAYGRPQDFPGTFPYLYRNEGGGKFTEVGKSAGLQIANPARKDVAAAKSLGVTFADFDSDGWLDIVVANDTVQNFLFHNKKDGTFEELAQERGVAFDQQGQARGAMGIDAARIRSGSAVAIAIGNFANEMTAFYVAQGDSMQFTDEAIATGIGPQSRLELKFGTLFVDVDLDGRLDIVSANGHLENEINKVQVSQQYEQPPHFFWNCGPASKTEFCPVPKEKCGEDFLKRMIGRGAATADIDGDGDLDLLFAATGAAPRLLRNDQQLGHHWLRMEVTVGGAGRHSQAVAIGSHVEVEFEDGRLLQGQIMPTRGYLSQSEGVVTFGLGSSDRIKRVTIHGSQGFQQTIDSPQIDRVLKILIPRC